MNQAHHLRLSQAFITNLFHYKREILGQQHLPPTACPTSREPPFPSCHLHRWSCNEGWESPIPGGPALSTWGNLSSAFQPQHLLSAGSLENHDPCLLCSLFQPDYDVWILLTVVGTIFVVILASVLRIRCRPRHSRPVSSAGSLGEASQWTPVRCRGVGSGKESVSKMEAPVSMRQLSATHPSSLSLLGSFIHQVCSAPVKCQALLGIVE